MLNTRQISAYPFKGSSFVCNDIIGIADAQEAMDSAMHIIEVGNPAATGHSRLMNTVVGGAYQPGNGNRWLALHPVCGQTNGITTFPRNFNVPAVFELIPQLNKYCIVLTARLQGSEFAITNLNNVITGNGGRASWFSVQLAGYNTSGAATTQLINRVYRDRTYHLTIPLAQQTASTAVDVNWDASEGEIQQFIITGTVNPSLFITGNQTANVGIINFTVDYPVHPLGTPWNAPNGTTMLIANTQHPATGIDYDCDGILDFQLYFYK